MELTKEQRLIQQVISRAWSDPLFKKALLAAPLDAIKELTGENIRLPKGKTLAVFDQSDPNMICLNIPPQPDFDDVQLTDNELEQVAGGVIPWPLIKGCFPSAIPPILEFSSTNKPFA